MAKAEPISSELSTLRAVTFRLKTTPTAQLPQQIPAITASLAKCKTLLSSVQGSRSKASSEASVAVHGYHTLLTTFLQHNHTYQGRWAAIVLIKTTIELGGWETLQKSLAWVRGLLGILTKPDPLSSTKLCLITLTRIFVLTREYATLVREITTPSLPAYIQTCLQIASSRSSPGLIQSILESFNQLLPRHPTIFRSYMKQLQQLIAPIIAPTPSNKLGGERILDPTVGLPAQVAEAARRLHVQLPCCAPKGASSEEWDKTMKEAVTNAHRVADKVLRAVIEDWRPAQRFPASVDGHTLDGEVQDLKTDFMDLPPWSGIYAGGERLLGILRLIKEYLATPTPTAVSLQIGLVVDLVTRMLSLTVPSSVRSSTLTDAVRFDNQVSKEERDHLWVILPQVHIATVEILLTLTSRCQQNASVLDSVILDQVVWVFGSERDDGQVRAACYLAITQILTRSGPTLLKASIEPLSTMIRACCDDLLSLDHSTISAKQTSAPGKANGTTQQQVSTNADAFLDSNLTSKIPAVTFPGLEQAAYKLLPVLLTSIRAQQLSDSLRTRMDRTAILIKHKDAMIASVLNPPPSKRFGKPAASILALLARSYGDEREVEAMLRPRMPVLPTGAQNGTIDDDMERDTEVLEGDNEDDHFVGEELDTLLESATQQGGNGGDQITDPSNYGTLETPALEDPPSPSKKAAIVPELTQLAGGIKRVQSEEAGSTPIKRVKADAEENPQPPHIPTVPTAIVSLTLVGTEAPVVVPALPDSVPQSVPSVTTAAVLPTGDKNEDSDDDDDFGELVLGQDTDEDESAA